MDGRRPLEQLFKRLSALLKSCLVLQVVLDVLLLERLDLLGESKGRASHDFLHRLLVLL